MSRAVVGKWGKNLAVRLSNALAEAAGLAEGAQVEIAAKKGEIIIRPVAPPLRLEALFEGKDPGAWRRLYRDAFDWGPDHGRETVSE